MQTKYAHKPVEGNMEDIQKPVDIVVFEKGDYCSFHI